MLIKNYAYSLPEGVGVGESALRECHTDCLLKEHGISST